MATYTVTIEINDTYVKRFNEQGWSLCFATGVANGTDGRPQYNVIAQAKSVTGRVSFTWTEEYGIAASSEYFENGVQTVAATSIASIRFGQSYVLAPSWMNGTVKNDTFAPNNGFVFENQTSKAAALVYKKIDGTFTPVYINNMAPLPPGKEVLVPKVTAAFWFSATPKSATMISRFPNREIELDMTNNSSRQATIEYTNNSTWSIKQNN